MSKPRVIAFYLPQFHPIPENDKWWGKGFTEWTNVGKAKALFPGHKQPKVPTDLGYYDLRLPEIYDEQTKLAKESGIEGFCFWHYYFGDGKQLLEKPLQRIVNESQNDFPFCLGWANESWEKKLWNKDSKGNITLIEQRYNGEKDYKRHFEIVKTIMMDDRYIKIDGKPLFLIYKPHNFLQCKDFIDCWRKLAIDSGLSGIHFVAHANEQDTDYSYYLRQGFDAVYTNRVKNGARGYQKNIFLSLYYFILKCIGFPRIVNYKEIVKQSIDICDMRENFYPGIICGWDHTPRSGRKGFVFSNFTMKLFKKHIESILALVEKKESEHKIIFLKSWNEWGEGNFMEPDMEFGHSKLDVLKQALSEKNNLMQTFI